VEERKHDKRAWLSIVCVQSYDIPVHTTEFFTCTIHELNPTHPYSPILQAVIFEDNRALQSKAFPLHMHSFFILAQISGSVVKLCVGQKRRTTHPRNVFQSHTSLHSLLYASQKLLLFLLLNVSSQLGTFSLPMESPPSDVTFCMTWERSTELSGLHLALK
jgi:hypothetical protein